MTIPNAPSGTIRAALRYPGFRWLLSGLAVSQTGDWLYNLALVVLVYQRTHSALWAGVTTAARVVPAFGLSALAVLAIPGDGDPSPFRVRRAADRPDGLLREVAQGAAARCSAAPAPWSRWAARCWPTRCWSCMTPAAPPAPSRRRGQA